MLEHFVVRANSHARATEGVAEGPVMPEALSLDWDHPHAAPSPETAPATSDGRVPLVFGVVALLTIATLSATYVMGLLTLAATRQVAELRTTVDDLRDTLSTLKDAETGQRGYLLTGDDSYLLPYNAAVSHIRLNLDSLDAQVRAGRLAAADVARLAELARAKLAELQETIDLRKQFGPRPDLDEINEYVLGTMQATLDELAEHRRFPVIG